MNRVAALVFALAVAVAPMAVEARGHSGGKSSSSTYSHRSHSSSHSTRSHSSSSHYSSGSRSHGTSHSAASHRSGSHGKAKRDPKQREAFMRSHPCPSTGKTHGACPGYVVDHVVPLKRGGADSPSNMQWQTKEAAKAKDKWE